MASPVIDLKIVSTTSSAEEGLRRVSSTAQSELGKVQTEAKKTSDHFDTLAQKGNSAASSIGGGFKNAVTGMVGLGSLLAGGAVFGDALKEAHDYNTEMATLRQSFKDAGESMPTAQINEMTDSMSRLGISENDTLTAIQQMTEAHVPATEQMNLLSAAADLATAKNIPLSDSLKDVELAAQGQGKALKDLGITLPATIPNATALANATTAMHKAQSAYTQDLEAYGPTAQKTIAAHQKLLDAQTKVDTITQEQANHYQNLSGVTSELEGRLGGLAQAQAAADPGKTLGVEFQTIERELGQQLLPYLTDFEQFVGNHMPEIEHGLSLGFGVVGDAIHAVGDAVHVVGPPLEDVLQFGEQHANVFEGIAASLAALYGARKVTGFLVGVKDDLNDIKNAASDVNSVSAVLQKMLGYGSAAGRSSGGGVSGLPQLGPTHVWVDNPGFGEGTSGGGPAGEAEGGAEGAGGGAVMGGMAGAAAPLAVLAAGLLGNANTAFNTFKGGDKAGFAMPGTLGISIPGISSATATGGGALSNLMGVINSTGPQQMADMKGFMDDMKTMHGATDLTSKDLQLLAQGVKTGAIQAESDLDAVVVNGHISAEKMADLAAMHKQMADYSNVYGPMSTNQMQLFSEFWKQGTGNGASIASAMQALSAVEQQTGPLTQTQLQVFLNQWQAGVSDTNTLVANVKSAAETSAQFAGLADQIKGMLQTGNDVAAGALSHLRGMRDPGSGSGTTAYAGGGILDEPVVGIGLHSKRRYTFGENAPAQKERISPISGDGSSRGGSGATINVYAQTNADPHAIARSVMFSWRTRARHL